MLKSLRKHTKVIVWAIVLVFISWGGFSVGVSFKKESRYAGEIFGKGVSFLEFKRAHRMSELFAVGGQETSDPELLRQQTWRNILYSREAKRQGIEVSDEEVRGEITRIFQALGVENLTPEIYERWLKRSVRLSAKEFEDQMRELLRIQKLLKDVFDRSKATPVTRDDALERFLRDSRRSRFEVVQFENFDDAVSFADRFKESGGWASLRAQTPQLHSEKADSIGYIDLLNLYQLPPETAEALMHYEQGALSEPVQLNGRYAVFYVISTKKPGEAAFDEATEKQYVENLTNENQQMHMFRWNLELLQRAGIKDFSMSEDGE